MRRIWEEPFTPAVFDLDVRSEVTPVALCRYFGIAAGHHASELGVGDETLRPRGIAWMLNRLDVQFRAVATGMEPLLVETWPSDRTGRLRAERDFQIRRGDMVIAEGLSTWLLIQLASRRPIRMPEEVKSAAVQGRQAPFEALDLKSSGSPGEAARWTLPAGWGDLDINGHVSFPRLVEWALNAAPAAHWAEHRLDSAVLRFEQEILPGEVVTASFDLEGQDGRHLLAKEDGVSAVRCWTKWRRS